MKVRTLFLTCGLVFGAAIPAQESQPAARLAPVILRVTTTNPDVAPQGLKVTVRSGRRGSNTSIPAVTPIIDADGRVTIDGLPRGGFMLEISAPGFATVGKIIRVPSTEELAVVLEPGRTLHGKIVDARDEQPVAGATVRADVVQTTTGADGTFKLDGLPRDEPDISVSINAKGYAFADVSIPAPEDGAPAAAIRLEPGWRACVQVVDDSGTPVEGVDVRGRLPFAVPYSSLERQDFQAKTDADGKAVLEGLPPRQPCAFQVASEATGGVQSEVVLPSRAARTETARTPVARVLLTQGRWITLRVHDGHEKPIAGAEIRMLPLVPPRLDLRGNTDPDNSRGSARSGATGADGEATFNALPAEILTCEVRAPGYVTQMVVVDARPTERRPTTVSLEVDPSPPHDGIPWSASVAEAVAEARSTGLPILVAMAMDGEAANDWMAAHHFRDSEVVRAARELPVLISSSFGAGGMTANGVEHAEVDGVCSRYGTIPCKAHQEIEIWARAEITADGRPFQVPRHAVLMPSGEIVMDRTYYLGERDLQRMMIRALRHAGADAALRLARERLSTLRRDLASTDDAIRGLAVDAIVALCGAGDEYAVALLSGMADDGVPAATRLLILDGLLLEALQFPTSALHGFLTDRDPAVRRRAFARLGELPEKDIDVDLVADRFWDPDDAVTVAFTKAMRIRDEPEQVTVDGPAAGQRWRLLEEIVSGAEVQHVRGLDDVLAAPFTEGRNRLIRALARSPEDPAAVRRLMSLAAATDASAVAPLRALGTILPEGDERTEATDLILQQLKSTSALVREEVVRIVSSARWKSNPLPALRSALSDECETVSVLAALGLWKRGDMRGAERLLSAMNNPELGDAVVAALAAGYTSAMPGNESTWRAWLKQHRAPPGSER